MKKNGLFAFALGFIFLAGTFVGCGTNTVGEPDYSDTDLKFHIGAWNENTEKFLKDMNVELLGELPMHRVITNYGNIELIEEEEEVAELFDPIVEKIINKAKKKLIL